MTKFCIKCKEEKEFHKNRAMKDGLASYCKDCSKVYFEAWKKKYPERFKEGGRKYQKKNSEKIRKYQKEYQTKNREKIREVSAVWRSKNRDKWLAARKVWRKNNPEKCREMGRRYKSKKMATPKGKAEYRLRSLFRQFLKSNPKEESFLALLGCSMEFFMAHIEEQFTGDMTWDNIGTWDFDHIIPCSYFDCTIYEERAVCWHWTNLQPLPRKENREKSYYLPTEDELKELITTIVNSL